MSRSNPTVHLSFDVEEFDLPNEYGGDLELDQQLEHGERGFRTVLPWMRELGAACTMFTTARFAEHAPELVREAAEDHEIASHGVRHDRFDPPDYADSRTRLEAITGGTITGFRRPRLQPIDPHACRAAGYRYDSSENPVRLPGRYDNRHLPRIPRFEDDLLRVPISASPKLRIPLFWLAWGNLPRPLLRSALDRTLAHDGRLILFFHPWEFIEPPQQPMPRVVRRRVGPHMLERVDRELRRLARNAEFKPMHELLAACPTSS